MHTDSKIRGGCPSVGSSSANLAIAVNSELSAFAVCAATFTPGPPGTTSKS
jgi:hypothetical protein